jgi:calmodulin
MDNSHSEDEYSEDASPEVAKESSWRFYHDLKYRKEYRKGGGHLTRQMAKVSIGRINDQAQLALRPHGTLHYKIKEKTEGLMYARVWAHEARNLVATDVNLLDGYAASDPLLEIRLGEGQPAQTRHIVKNLNPKWDERLVCECQPILFNTNISDIDFTITVYDKDLLSEDDPIGKVSWNIMDMIKKKKPVASNQRFLRVKIHRCIGLTAGDADGYSDPYVKVQFCGMAQATRVYKRTLCPEFDEADFWFSIPRDEDLYASFEKDWDEMEMTPAIKRAGATTQHRVKLIMRDRYELLSEAFRVYSNYDEYFNEDAEDLEDDYAADLRVGKPSWDQSEEDADETISFKEFIRFCEDTKILNKKAGISRRTLKEIFRRVNTESEGDVDGIEGGFRQQGDSQLERSEFFECLLYLAGLVYRKHSNPKVQVEMLIDEMIEPALTKPSEDGIVRVNINPPDLRVSVWDCDAVGDDDFLGEAYIALGEAARQDISKESALQYGRRWPLRKRPGHMNRFEKISGSVYVTAHIVNADEDEYGHGFKNEGHHRFEFNDWYTLEYHEDMEGEVDPEDMSGEVRLTGTLLIPKDIIAKEKDRLQLEQAYEEEKENDLTFTVHAIDEWSSKSFPLKIMATDPDFKWLAGVVAQRYSRFLKPHGRTRVRESGQHLVQSGQLTPYNIITQLPAGTDRLGAPPHPLMSKVNGSTKIRDILLNGDNIWVEFQNKKVKNVVAGLTQLQKEQKAVDANRRWLKRLCREEEIKIQVAIAQRFKRLQEEDGKTIVEIFEDFDDDGGGTIDHEELRMGFDSLDIELSEEQFKQMLTIWDESGDGEIDYEEFAEMFERIQKMLDEDYRRPLVHFDAFENTGAIRRKPEIGKKVRKERVKEEDKAFELDSSVFAERKIECDSEDYFETPETLRKALLQDLKHAHRIKGLFPDKSDMSIVQVLLTEHFVTIFDTFKKYAADEPQHGYFMMSWNSYSKWCNDMKILDKRNVRIRDIDQIFVKVNVQTRGAEQNHQKALQRFEFLEAIVRLALMRYRTLKTEPEKLKTFLEKHLVAHADQSWSSENFRREFVYTEDVHKVLYKRIIGLKKIYKENSATAGPTEDYIELMTLKEFLKLMGSVDIVSKADYSYRKAVDAYIQSQMMTLDEQNRDSKDKRRDSHETMTMVEFLEALVRISANHPRCDGENITEKLTALLALLFQDAQKVQKKALSMFGGGAGAKKGGGLAGLFKKK